MNTTSVGLIGFFFGMILTYLLICLMRMAFFDKNEFDTDKPGTVQVWNPFKINYSNVSCPATTPTLDTCVSTYSSNCFKERSDSTAVTFCGSSGDCDLTPFGELTGTTYYAAADIDTSNLLNMYNETTLNVASTTNDIFAVSNVTTLGACYIAKKMNGMSGRCIDVQTSLKGEGINLSNAQMNTMFTSCTLDATGNLVIADTNTITALTFDGSGLDDKCTALGYDLS